MLLFIKIDTYGLVVAKNNHFIHVYKNQRVPLGRALGKPYKKKKKEKEFISSFFSIYLFEHNFCLLIFFFNFLSFRLFLCTRDYLLHLTQSPLLIHELQSNYSFQLFRETAINKKEKHCVSTQLRMIFEFSSEFSLLLYINCMYLISIFVKNQKLFLCTIAGFNIWLTLILMSLQLVILIFIAPDVHMKILHMWQHYEFINNKAHILIRFSLIWTKYSVRNSSVFKFQHYNLEIVRIGSLCSSLQKHFLIDIP